MGGDRGAFSFSLSFPFFFLLFLQFFLLPLTIISIFPCEWRIREIYISITRIPSRRLQRTRDIYSPELDSLSGLPGRKAGKPRLSAPMTTSSNFWNDRDKK